MLSFQTKSLSLSAEDVRENERENAGGSSDSKVHHLSAAK